MAAKRKKASKKFDVEAEVRSIARERVGTVKPSKVIIPKSEKKPRHKRDPLDEVER